MLTRALELFDELYGCGIRFEAIRTLLDTVDGGGVGVIQACEQLGFAFEARHAVEVGGAGREGRI